MESTSGRPTVRAIIPRGSTACYSEMHSDGRPLPCVSMHPVAASDGTSSPWTWTDGTEFDWHNWVWERFSHI